MVFLELNEQPSISTNNINLKVMIFVWFFFFMADENVSEWWQDKHKDYKEEAILEIVNENRSLTHDCIFGISVIK